MVEEVGAQQYDLSPFAEWSASPMGLAGRDPIFHAQLELERNIARDQPGLADIIDCIDNTCLHCHGVMGARQSNIDTAGHRVSSHRGREAGPGGGELRRDLHRELPCRPARRAPRAVPQRRLARGGQDRPIDGLPFQPHHLVVTAEDQVQIYEELNQNSSMRFTSSFIHRYWTVKDNRLRPQGWGWNQAPPIAESKRPEYLAATRPGTGPEQSWFARVDPVEAPAYANPDFPALDDYRDTAEDPDYGRRAAVPGRIQAAGRRPRRGRGTVTRRPAQVTTGASSPRARPTRASSRGRRSCRSRRPRRPRRARWAGLRLRAAARRRP